MPGKRISKTAGASNVFYSKAFKEGIPTLMGEIQLAMQWSRPSILVAVHNGSRGQEKARAQLKKEILALGKKVRNIEPGPRVIPAILSSTDHASTVFFVSGIGSLKEDVRRDLYRELNFQRERLVENRIVLVLWLGLQEAAEMPRFAPDFWSFRHRVVEFAPDRGATR